MRKILKIAGLLCTLAYPFQILACDMKEVECYFSTSNMSPTQFFFDETQLFGDLSFRTFPANASSYDDNVEMDIGELSDSEESSEAYPLYSHEMKVFSPLNHFNGTVMVLRNEPVDIEVLTDKQFDCFNTSYDIQLHKGPYCVRGGFRPSLQANPRDQNFIDYLQATGQNKLCKVLDESPLTSLFDCKALHLAVLKHLLHPGGIYVLSIHNPADMDTDRCENSGSACWPSYVGGASFTTPEEITSYYSQTKHHFLSMGFSKVEFSFSEREFLREEGMPISEKEVSVTKEEAALLKGLNLSEEEYDIKWEEIVYNEAERDERLQCIQRAPVYMILTK